MKNKDFLRILCVVSLSIGCIMSNNALAGDFERIPADSVWLKEVNDVSKVWMKAVVNRDVNLLLTTVDRDDRGYIEKDFFNQKSLLIKILFRRKNSVQKFFLRLKKTKIVAFKHKSLESVGQGTSVCYFDGSKPEPNWFKNNSDPTSWSDSKNILCIFMTKYKSEWYVSYRFSEKEGD